MSDAFVGRQEILDRDQNVFGYELLYRSGDVDQASITHGDMATSSVIVNVFLEIGIESIVGSRLAFMNFTRGFLLEKDMLAFPHDRMVVEVLEDVLPEAEIIETLEELSEHGYLIALDDFVFRKERVPLIEHADFVKLDLRVFDESQLREQVELLRPFPVKLVAEKVESHEEFELCLELGFHYFQGFHFTRPRVISKRRLPVNQATTVRLMSRLYRPGTTTDDLEPIISQDVALSYKLLRYINSVYHGLSSKVTSIKQAIVLLGVSKVRSWATVLLLSSANDKPQALMVTALFRAKMCEQLADIYPDRGESFFLAGLFSVLDALLDTDMKTILEELPVSDDIRLALVEHEGTIGQILDDVVAYERGDWDRLAVGGRSAEALSDAYLKAIAWADECASRMSATSS